MVTKHKHKRYVRNYLINPYLQMRFSFYFLIGFFVSMTVVHGFLFWKLHTFMEDFTKHYPIQGPFHLQLHDIFNSLIISTVVTIALASIGIFVISIGYSHKFAGPAYVLKASIEKMIKGDYEIRPGLREGDELIEVANALKKLADQYKERESKN
ncbi:MAG: hypothetical protein KDD43_12040 [Bdellovibrionales bacterium]|nr:hypothetical protein [Bdellovibrionales bacterium]